MERTRGLPWYSGEGWRGLEDYLGMVEKGGEDWSHVKESSVVKGGHVSPTTPAETFQLYKVEAENY